MEKTRKPKRKTAITSFRLTPDAITLLRKLTVKTGLSRSGVLEVAIRDLASNSIYALAKEAKK